MKKIFAFALLVCSGVVYADCTSTLVTNANTALSGYTIHGNAASGSDSWNEQHRANGDLCEIAQGNGHPVDPSHIVGSWSASGSQVTYTYPGNPPYVFTLRSTDTDGTPGNADTFYFCNGAVLVATAGRDTAACTP